MRDAGRLSPPRLPPRPKRRGITRYLMNKGIIYALFKYYLKRLKKKTHDYINTLARKKC